MEFEKPPQPSTTFLRAFFVGYLKSEAERLDQEAADHLSGRQLTPGEIYDVAWRMRRLRTDIDHIGRDVTRFMENLSDRLKVRGVELPTDHDVARAIIDGRNFDEPSKPKVELEEDGIPDYEFSFENEEEDEDEEDIPFPLPRSRGSRRSIGNQTPSEEVRIVRVEKSKALTEEKAREYNRQIGSRLDDTVLLRGLYNWRANQANVFKSDETPWEWIEFMNALPKNERGNIRHALNRVIKVVNVRSPYWELNNFDCNLGDLRIRLQAGPLSLGEGREATAIFLREFFAVPASEPKPSESDS